MAKGIFTQGVALLTNGQTTIDDVKAVLSQHGFRILKECPPDGEWAFGGATLIIAFRPPVNGYVAVDLVNHSWPDEMGDPKSDPTTLAAWSMGHFAPLAYPGGLARAQQHSWSWPAGRDAPEGHRGFLRVRLSYCFGAPDDASLLPADNDPLEEMMFLSRVVLALFKVPGVVCYFNPNGEVLRDEKAFREVWERCTNEQMLPLSLWMNIRFFKLNESLGFMDTVGNGQLDARDIEAAFPMSEYQPGDIDNYLRNVTHYLLDLKREMQTGEDIDGPGETNLSWSIEVRDDGVVEPPRSILRLYPKAICETVRGVLSAVEHSGRERDV